MTYDAFLSRLRGLPAPVVLLEGTRALAPDVAPRLVALAERLARALPHARFRTGNAPGSDTAFAEGVGRVDAARLLHVLPHAGHRARHRPQDVPTAAVTEVTDDTLGTLLTVTREASPQYGFSPGVLAETAHPRPRATARLLLRDTLKVVGTDGMPPADIGLFYVNPADPLGGGTGHTMRVCHARGVPVLTQDVWFGWDEARA